MAIYTEADRTAVKEALIEAATTNVASVSIRGHQTRTYTLDELRALLKEINADLAGAKPHFGLRMTKLKPPGCG